jgi:hypothetical protein
MLKEFMRELQDVLTHLERTGYFDARKQDRVVTQKTSNGRKGQRPGYEHDADSIGKKLTPELARDIYTEDRFSIEELAELYNVHKHTIYQIKKGITWWKVTGHPRVKYTRKKSS